MCFSSCIYVCLMPCASLQKPEPKQRGRRQRRNGRRTEAKPAAARSGESCEGGLAQGEWMGRKGGEGANANVSLLDVCGVKGEIQKRFSEGWRNGRLAALCLDGARSAKGGELYVLWVEGGVRRRNHCRDGVLSTGLQIQPQSGRREPLSVWKGGAFFCNRREENAPDWSGGSLLM